MSKQMNDEAMDAQERRARHQQLQLRFQQILSFDLKPEKIAALLCQSVLGQDEACRALAVRLRQHILKVREMHSAQHTHSKPSPTDDLGGVLLLGPTGCGKTHLMRTLTNLSSLIFHAEDASCLTETGYVGRDISDVARAIVDAADGYRPLATTALVFLDEIDKLRFRPDGNGKDITGEGVQRSLLSLLDGGQILFCLDDRQRTRNMSLPTDLLFITLAGAFSGLDQIVTRRLGRRESSFGFARQVHDIDYARRRNDLLQEVTAEDLIAYGFMPELVGRLRDIVVIQPLSAEAMRAILLHPTQGPLVTYQRMAAREGFGLELTEELADRIVERATRSDQGARVLKRIITQVTQRVMFELPSSVRCFGQTVALLGVKALEDGSYEIRTSPAKNSTQGIARMNSELEALLGKREETAFLEGESTAGEGDQSASTSLLLTTQDPVRPCRTMEEEIPVSKALARSAEAVAELIADQIRADGHDVEHELELKMKGSQVGVSNEGCATPAARVTLWVANPQDPKAPPELPGQRLRMYVRRANIATTGWHLRRGARACGTKCRQDKRRWRRHVVLVGLDHDHASL